MQWQPLLLGLSAAFQGLAAAEKFDCWKLKGHSDSVETYQRPAFDHFLFFLFLEVS